MTEADKYSKNQRVIFAKPCGQRSTRRECKIVADQVLPRERVESVDCVSRADVLRSLSRWGEETMNGLVLLHYGTIVVF
jgi:hypothetical protein